MSILLTGLTYPDYTPSRRRGFVLADAGHNPLSTPLYKFKGTPRTALITPTWKRPYPGFIADTVSNTLLGLAAIVLNSIPIGTQPELGFLYLKARIAHQPILMRPAVGANPPFTPPITPAPDMYQPLYRRDRMVGQEFVNEIFLTPNLVTASLVPVEFVTPMPRKWLIPEFGSNSRIPLSQLVVAPPFFQNDWDNYTRRTRSKAQFDDVYNPILSIIAPVSSGPPFQQTDFPYVDWKQALKEGTYFDWQNALIPNTKIPPTPFSITINGTVIYGVFYGNKIFGLFQGGNNVYN